MIYEITSDLSTFKSLKFKTGLNVLLADKSAGATDRQSRNGAGKTCVIELIHFLLGSQVGPSSIFRSSALESYTFKAALDLDSTKVEISRSGNKPSRIGIDGTLPNLQVAEQLILDDPHHELSNEEWKDLLGTVLFDLPIGETARSRAPSYRSLLSMFLRRQEAGGFQSPTKHFTNQSVVDQQITSSYLLGLDWTISERFKRLKDEEKAATDLRRAMQSGEFGREFGTVAELRTRVTVAEARTKRLREQIDQYQVVPKYRQLEHEASQKTSQISELNAANIADHELLEELEKSFQSEEVPAAEDITRLYDEVGIVLPSLAVQRLRDVEVFHNRIVENRRSHLDSEITAARRRLEEREHQKKKLDDRRQEIMETLRKGGALEHFASLQEELARDEALFQELRNRLEMGEKVESTKTRLQVERNVLLQDLRQDIHERREILDEAVLRFEELSQALYEEEGSFIVTPTQGGLKFEVHIAAERSKGITNMQIFCFDFMVATLAADNEQRWPGFVVHDSHLFDGVDERQVARALQVGAQCATDHGFQYIVAMNSDAIPRDGFEESFCLDDYVLDVRLSDASETGGLFGIRFD